ncbi:MAG: glycosyltransferase [Eubacterium sp.]|nr:glycosyltransferase [Candidatus Colimonas fimequi]
MGLNNNREILVSVIVPVYNVEEWLRECLDSIVCQMPGSIEVILVDDGSTDSSGQICDEYASKYDFVRVYHESNGGLSFARNVGVPRARGKYITFIDSDDLFTEGALQLLYDKAEETSADVVVGDAKRYSPERGIRDSRLMKVSAWHLPKDGDVTTFRDSPYLTFNLTAWNKLIRRDFYVSRGIEFPEGFLYEDAPTMTNLLLEAERIGVVRETVYLWRVRENTENVSITQQFKGEKIVSDRCQLLGRIRDQYEQVLDSDVAKDAMLRKIRVYKWLDYDIPAMLRDVTSADEEHRNWTLDMAADCIKSFKEWPEFGDALKMCRPINFFKTKALISGDREKFLELEEYRLGEYRDVRALQTAEVRMYKKLLLHCRQRGIKLIASGVTERNLKKLNGMGLHQLTIRLVVRPEDFRAIAEDAELAEMYSVKKRIRGIFKRRLVIGYHPDAAEYDVRVGEHPAVIYIEPDKALPELDKTTIKSHKFEYTAMYALR